jgi:hypothetical protein
MRPGHLAKVEASCLPIIFHRSTFVRTKSRMPRHVFAGALNWTLTKVLRRLLAHAETARAEGL